MPLQLGNNKQREQNWDFPASLLGGGAVNWKASFRGGDGVLGASLVSSSYLSQSGLDCKTSKRIRWKRWSRKIHDIDLRTLHAHEDMITTTHSHTRTHTHTHGTYTYMPTTLMYAHEKKKKENEHASLSLSKWDLIQTLSTPIKWCILGSILSTYI